VPSLRSRVARLDQPQLPGIRNPVTLPPLLLMRARGPAHALPSRVVEPRAACFGFAATRHSSTAAHANWCLVSLCVRS